MTNAAMTRIERIARLMGWCQTYDSYPDIWTATKDPTSPCVVSDGHLTAEGREAVLMYLLDAGARLYRGVGDDGLYCISRVIKGATVQFDRADYEESLISAVLEGE